MEACRLCRIEALYSVTKDGQVLFKKDLILQKGFQQQPSIDGNSEVSIMKDKCFSQARISGYIKPDEGISSFVFYLKKSGDVIFMAKVFNSPTYVSLEQLWIIQLLKSFAEVIEETIGLDQMREYAPQLSMLIDNMLDHGYPLISSKPFFTALLQQPSSQAMNLINKVMAAGAVRDKHAPLLNAVTSQSNDWRWNEKNVVTGIPEVDQLSQTLVKDVYLDHNDVVSGIFPDDISFQTEALLESNLTGSVSNPRVIFKIRLGLNQRDVDTVCDKMVELDKNLSNQEIAGQQYFFGSIIPPLYGKAKIMKTYFDIENGRELLPFELIGNLGDSQSSGVIPFDLKFSRLHSGVNKESGAKIYPQLEQIAIQIHFPDEATGTNLISVNEGTFSYDQGSKKGLWTILKMQNEQSNILKLSGGIKVPNNHIITQLSTTLSLKIVNYSVTNSVVERLTCSTGGGKQDDPSVFKGVKMTTYVRDLEYKLQ